MIGGLHRIVLFCRDTDASKEWYERVGFAYKHGYDGMHWFALGGGEIMLHPAHPEPNEHGLNGINDGNVPAIHAATKDLDNLFEHVKRQGLAPYDPDAPDVVPNAPVVRPWGEREFELTDPDGHRWVFTEVREPDGS